MFRSPRLRRLVRWALAAAGVWLMLAAVQLFLAYRDASKAADAASEVNQLRTASDVVGDAPLDSLARAHDQFASARDRLGGITVAPLRLVPVLGRQVEAGHALAESGADITAGLDELARTARALTEDAPDTPAARVAAVESVAEAVTAARATVAAVDLGPASSLLPPLADAHNRVAAELERLDLVLARAEAGTQGLHALLATPGRYLVLVANNAEMRAGSGMFLSASILEIDGGALDLAEVRRTPSIPAAPDPVALPDDLSALWAFMIPNIEWRNLGVSPRFDVTAPLAAQMWEAAGQGPVDGVLAIDAVAMRSVLAATGPIEIDGRSIGADDVEEFILHDQYAALSDDGDIRSEEQDERRERSGELARLAVEALDAGEWDPAVLVEEIADAAAGRHLLAWSSRPAEATAFSVAGIDGALEPDSLLVGLSNVAGKKLDWFVRVQAELVLVGAEDGATDVELRLDVRNTTPADEAAYILGPNRNTTGLGPGDYRALLSVSLPGAAMNAAFDPADGLGPLVAAGRDGPTSVIAVQVEVPRGRSRTFVLRFRLPAGADSLRVEPSARVPDVGWTVGEEFWRDTRRRQLSWAPALSAVTPTIEVDG